MVSSLALQTPTAKPVPTQVTSGGLAAQAVENGNLT